MAFFCVNLASAAASFSLCIFLTAYDLLFYVYLLFDHREGVPVTSSIISFSLRNCWKIFSLSNAWIFICSSNCCWYLRQASYILIDLDGRPDLRNLILSYLPSFPFFDHLIKLNGVKVLFSRLLFTSFSSLISSSSLCLANSSSLPANFLSATCFLIQVHYVPLSHLLKFIWN